MDQQLQDQKNPEEVCTELLRLLSLYRDRCEGKNSRNSSLAMPGLKKEGKVKLDVKKQIGQHRCVLPSRKTKWVSKISFEEQKEKYELQKFIALSFVEHGINFHFVTRTYPELSPKAYRCTVEAINNQAVNDIINFLRFECNVQVEKLNRDQKRSIRTQLTKIKEWLGNRNNTSLDTFYKFILRNYDKSIQITLNQALNVYKTIVNIIRCPFVNVLEVEEGEAANQENTNELEEKAMLLLYIKHKDYSKVAD